LDTVRIFIAIELPPPVLDRLDDLQARLRQDLPARWVRWVRPQGMHLTLKFLGENPASRVDAVSAAMVNAAAAHAPFSLSVHGLGCFPNLRRPRVLWVGVEEPAGVLAALQRDVERALVPLGFSPEARPFSPHLTLGRVRGGARGQIEALGQVVGRAKARVGEMPVAAIHLMRSDLLPGGAVYTSLSVARLGD
jgi:RNA 2',3'-cyclic 3'-phosphodiesterase